MKPTFSWLLNKKNLIFIIDLLMVPIAWLGAYWLRFNFEVIPHHHLEIALNALPFVLVGQACCNLFYGINRGLWRFASISDISRIIKSALLGTGFIVLVLYGSPTLRGVPRTVVPLYLLFLISLVAGLRLVFRWFREMDHHASSGSKVLIIGAGNAGDRLVRELRQNYSDIYNPIGFIDDHTYKVGQEIHGLRVLGTTHDFKQVISKYQIDRIFIATPTASSANMRRIVSHCEESGLPFSTLPSLHDLTSGRVSIKDLREVRLEDLLGRDQVLLDWPHIRKALNKHTILITGGGGSIGSELCRQIASLAPECLIIVDNCEFNVYRIGQEIEAQFPKLDFIVHLVSVTDEVAMRAIISKYKPDVIFHAAAYKHVPMLENEIRAAVMNNVIGTRVVAEAAVFAKVKKMVLISTDKAVNPTNIMGATKRIAEIFCQNYDGRSTTQFITVRFGNVLGSAGSVVPLFKQQLEAGGPLTVTHPDITRYFMTIPEASQLIMQATAMGNGGEIYVLDMGEPIKIRYLAEQMIQLAGKKVGQDIDIIYTGLRPGEKLFEELLHENEKLIPTSHHKILMANHRQVIWDDLIDIMDILQNDCKHYPSESLANLLRKLVPEFRGGEEVVVE